MTNPENPNTGFPTWTSADGKYTVIERRDPLLIDRWLDDAEKWIEYLKPAPDRHRELLALGQVDQGWSLEEVQQFVPRLEAHAERVLGPANQDAVHAGLETVKRGVTELRVPHDEPERVTWNANVETINQGVRQIQDASQASAAAYAKVLDAGKTLTFAPAKVPCSTMVTLEDGGIPVATAVFGTDVERLNLDHLAASPELLAANGSGVGKVLMEHLVRTAKDNNLQIVLEPVSPASRSVYEHWGFTVLGPEALPTMKLNVNGIDNFLTRHRSFEPATSEPSASAGEQPRTPTLGDQPTPSPNVATLAENVTAMLNANPNNGVPQPRLPLQNTSRPAQVQQFGGQFTQC